MNVLRQARGTNTHLKITVKQNVFKRLWNTWCMKKSQG